MSQSLTPTQQETLNTFVAMTNADVEVSKAFLKACSWDANTAMDRFFTFNGDVSKLKPPSSNSVQPQPQQPSNPGIMTGAAAAIQNSLYGLFGGGDAAQNNNLQRVQPIQPIQPMQPMQPSINNANNNNNNNNNTNMSQMDADALLAQQLSAQSQPQQPQIRAPDAAFHDQLVGPYGNQFGSTMRKIRMDAQQNFAKDWERGPKNPKSSFLGALFSDPTYKYVGSLEDAKKKGSRENKWLLVNIQDSENFTSHVLNRDIWKGKELEDVIKESFVFYQWARTTDNARRVINLYHLNKFPCVIVLDPATGRKEYEFPVPDQPDKVITVKDKILEFLDDYPNPKAKPKKVIPHAPSSKQMAPQSHEDELLQKAIQESLKNDNTNNNTSNSNGYNKDDAKMDVDSPPPPQKKEEEIPQEAPLQEQLQLDPQPEPDDKSATAIRVRMPNGSVLQRRFKKDAKVQQLYVWLMLSLNDGKKVSLIQTMPRMKLNDEKDKTLQQLGLIRATLVCSYDD